MEQYIQPAPTALQSGASLVPAPELAQEPLPATPQRREKLQLLWGDLLQAAVREPGLILEAYSRFHGYSLGNRLAALVQCHTRGLESGPIHTYQGWKQLGRQVRSGEKALWLCMPLTRKVRDNGREKVRPNDSGEEASDTKHGEVISAFVWKPHWFVYAQTDSLNGEDAEPVAPLPSPAFWNKAQALEKLGILEIPFDLMDGNCQGYAKERSVAVSPLAALPFKTLFHEMAHVVLGHTTEGECIDGEELPDPQPRHIREAEAESTALLLLATLDLPGQEYCRGYIQSWLNRDGNGEGLGESSARRIFGAADKILSAGIAETEPEVSQPEQHSLPQESSPTPLFRTAFSDVRSSQTPSQPSFEFEQMPVVAASLTNSTLPHLATYGRPPPAPLTPSLEGEIDLFQMLMWLHDLRSEISFDARRHQAGLSAALTYLQSRDPARAEFFLQLLHSAAGALDLATRVANGAIDWPAIENFYNPQGLGSPLPQHAPQEARPSAEEAIEAPLDDTPQSWLTNGVATEEGAATNGITSNETPTNGVPTSERAAAQARRTLGRSLRSELEQERKRFFAIAEKHELPTGRESARAIREALSQLLEIPVQSRADLTARQWALAGSAIETGDLRW